MYCVFEIHIFNNVRYCSCYFPKCCVGFVEAVYNFGFAASPEFLISISSERSWPSSLTTVFVQISTPNMPQFMVTWLTGCSGFYYLDDKESGGVMSTYIKKKSCVKAGL